MAQKTGALIFDEQTDRYDIRFDIADYYGGLHCGECLDVFTGGISLPLRGRVFCSLLLRRTALKQLRRFSPASEPTLPRGERRCLQAVGKTLNAATGQR